MIERGKFRMEKGFLSTLHFYLDEGWNIEAVSHKKDSDGFYWIFLTRINWRY